MDNVAQNTLAGKHQEKQSKADKKLQPRDPEKRFGIDPAAHTA